MSTTGNRGRFSDRIKKIAMRKRRRVTPEDLEDSNTMYINFLKVVAAIPGMVYGNVVQNEKKGDELLFDNRQDVFDNDEVALNNNVKSMEGRRRISRVNGKKIISDIDIHDIKRQQTNFDRNNIRDVSVDNIAKRDNLNVSDTKKIDVKETDNNRVQELEKSIIDIIKQNLIKTINEMEILQSELYILSEINGDSKVVQDCQRELDQIKLLLDRVRKLKDQYDFLQDNYDFEYMLEIDDNSLADKIIELKDLFGNNEVKALVQDYKLLEEYKYLYLKIDDLQEKAANFEEHKQQQIEELKQRDIDFEQFKNNVYNISTANNQYNSFVKQQNEMMREIDETISKIDSHEVVNYHLKGFNKLFFNSFKYFGLLMLSPLKGLIPSIATETLVTRDVVNNLRKNLTWEEDRKMVYEAMDYSSLISNAINDLESTNRIVDTTLDDIVRLKMQYNEQFRKYQGDFSEYQDIMRKLNDMENKILGNKIKIEIMRKRALEQERENNKKMRLVKELNKEQK